MELPDTISRKRQRVANQITGGIVSNAGAITDSVLPNDGYMYFKCASRDGKTEHTIKMTINDDRSMSFVCNCAGGTGTIPSGHCIHLNNTMIHVCKQFIHASVKFMTDKEQHIVLKQKLSELDDLMSKTHIS